MIEVYDECKKAIANNKCSECNEYYSCDLCDYVEECKQQVRADTIDEFESLLYQFGRYEAYSARLVIYQYDLKKLIKQLEEQKNV